MVLHSHDPTAFSCVQCPDFVVDQLYYKVMSSLLIHVLCSLDKGAE